MSRNRRIALFFASLLFPLGAGAADLVFEFTGKVIFGGTLAPVDAPVTGTFSYDTRTTPWFETEDTAFYLLPAPHYIDVNVAGRQAIGAGVNASVTNDAGGNVEDVVNLYSSGGAMLDGEFLPEGTVGVVFGSDPGSTGAVRTLRLPARYDLDRFDVQGGNGGYLMRDGGPDGFLLQFSIESVVVRRICREGSDASAPKPKDCVVR
jgi:hypothetical protein